LRGNKNENGECQGEQDGEAFFHKLSPRNNLVRSRVFSLSNIRGTGQPSAVGYVEEFLR
jgi:hypothetical protein